jgi:hypothetical protein
MKQMIKLCYAFDGGAITLAEFREQLVALLQAADDNALGAFGHCIAEDYALAEDDRDPS